MVSVSNKYSMNMYFNPAGLTISLTFILCLLIPSISLADRSSSLAVDDSTTTPLLKQLNASTTNTPQIEKKEILSEDRDLGGFFIIGLIINLVMMSSFFIWALGQWRKTNKTSSKK